MAPTVLGACAAESASQGDAVDVRTESAVAPTIFGGSADANDHHGVVALRVGEAGSYDLCSGALVAPNVVLTARHCVVRSVTSTVACDELGASINGAHVDDAHPRSIALFSGATPDFNAPPDAVGRSIVAPSGSSLCDSDIALVILDHALHETPFALRLDAGIATGEHIRTVGYGQNNTTLPVGTRLRKDGVSVLAKGSGVSKYHTALGTHEFEVGRSICQGDSGGPAISEATGAIVGVVSRGGGCDDEFGHIYTTTAGWSELFQKAFAQAGATPTVELEVASETPDPATANAAEAGCSAAPSSQTTRGSALALVIAAALGAGVRRRRRR